MENTKNKEELIEELEGILKANKDNVYCDEYQIADMVREALKLYDVQTPEVLRRAQEAGPVQLRTRAASVAAVEIAGIKILKIYNMANTNV